MKIMLAAFNAKYIHSNLAVYDLKAYAQKYASNVILKEYTINQQKDDILRDIYLEQPDVVCVSCYIWNITFVKELMRDLGKNSFRAFPSGQAARKFLLMQPQFLEENQEFTGVMAGEGEETFLELAGHYIEQKPEELKEITGICYRDAEGIHHNGWRHILDLSSIPFIYENLEDFKNRIIYYESSRGCPFSCSYCLLPLIKSSGSGIRSW